MGKKAAERQLSDSEAMAFAKHIRVSPRKLNLVAQSIRGLDCEKALVQLSFSHRRVAEDLRSFWRARLRTLRTIISLTSIASTFPKPVLVVPW
jgi:ribosomal protein L22